MSGPDVRLEQCEAVPVAVVRRQVRQSELSRVVPQGCGTVWQFVRANGLEGGRHVAIYWDGSIRLEVGVEVATPFAEAGEVVRSATPAGPAVVATHFGPYSSLGAAHQAALRFCEQHGHALAGPSWEVYGHWRPEWNADPSQIRTDVYYAVTPADR